MTQAELQARQRWLDDIARQVARARPAAQGQQGDTRQRQASNEPLIGLPFYSARLGAWLRDIPSFNCGRVSSSGKEVLALHPRSPLRSFMITPPAPVMVRPFIKQDRQPNVILPKCCFSEYPFMLACCYDVLLPLGPVIITEIQTYPDRRWHCFHSISLAEIENLSGTLYFRWCAPTPPRPGAPMNRHAGHIGHLPHGFRLLWHPTWWHPPNRQQIF